MFVWAIGLTSCSIYCLQDLNAVGEGRGTVLGLKLDKLSDSVSGQTVVDPKAVSYTHLTLPTILRV